MERGAVDTKHKFVVTCQDQYRVYTGRLETIIDNGMLEDDVINVATFGRDEEKFYIGSQSGKFYTCSLVNNEEKPVPEQVFTDKPINNMVYVDEIPDQDVFLMVVNESELYLYDMKTKKANKIEIDEDRVGPICDLKLSTGAKFFVFGVPSKDSFGVYKLDHTTLKAESVKWIRHYNFTQFYVDESLS